MTHPPSARIAITLSPTLTLRRFSAARIASTTRMRPSRSPVAVVSTPLQAASPRAAASTIQKCTRRMNCSRSATSVFLARLRARSSGGTSSIRVSTASARSIQPLGPIGVDPTRHSSSSPRSASATRVKLLRPRSYEAGPLARERALSVIECELLVLTYHCESYVPTAINVVRAKWAPERSIPKHVRQNKIGARRAARWCAKRARRGSCAPSSSVRLRGRRDQLGSRALPSSVRHGGRRDRFVAGSKSETIRQRESHPRL
jgi:hypothetical protein